MHDYHEQAKVFLNDEIQPLFSVTCRHYVPAIPSLVPPTYLLWNGILNPLTNVLACSWAFSPVRLVLKNTWKPCILG